MVIFYRKTKKDEDLNKRAERDTKISALGYEPTEEYVRETYGEGWVKKAVVAPVPMVEPQNFSEPDMNYIQNRADQMSIVNAADQVASNYEDVIGDRVNQLLGFAESEDANYESVQRFLVELMKEQPSAKAVDTIQKASFASRLLGLFRGQ